jgi:adenine-specific DNA-methyltransferase
MVQMDGIATQIVAARRKELGAFYTPPEMADKLVRWALRTPDDRVLDPSFGGLVFLGSAYDRLRVLGATPINAQAQIFGGELDDDAHRAALADSRFGPGAQLVRGDFLRFSPGVQVPAVDAVVGNPPYVRYQGFNGSGTHGHELAARAGVRLTRLASSWAPFVVHGTSFIREGGRMAQVLPAEILHAQYADGVLAFLRRNFASVMLVLFERRVFPGTLEEVVLLFADGRGLGPSARVRVLDCIDVAGFDVERLRADETRESAPNEPASPLLAQLLPLEIRKLYGELAGSPHVRRLGDLASVDIGAVTGANKFFLVSRADGRVPPRFLRPAVSKAAHVSGARLTREDLEQLTTAGKPMHMLVIEPTHPRDDLGDVQPYLDYGRQGSVHERYKCRVRDPWWALPLPRHGVPDAFLTYCASEHPRLAVNEAGALHTNTVHGLKMRDGVTATDVAAGFINSLTLLSVELVGRSYGGGVLKLEPTEAEAVLVPRPRAEVGKHLGEVDDLIRGRLLDRVLDVADPLILGDRGLGLSADQIALLRAAGARLRARRRARGRAPGQ